MRLSGVAANTALFITLSNAQNFLWSCNPKSVQTCNNACFAMDHGLAVETLTKDTTLADDNRKLSGCKAKPCKKKRKSTSQFQQYGNSCDEFPFATVEEGGPDAILRCVAQSDNSSEGGQLGNFYDGLLNGHTFEVVIQDFDNVYFCENAGASNDGQEFYYDRSQKPRNRFQAVPRGESSSEDANHSFVPMSRNATITSHHQREYFESEEGKLLMRITRGHGKDLVGTHVHDEFKRPVLIHRRVDGAEAEDRILRRKI